MLERYILAQPLSTWVSLAALVLSVISLARTARIHRTSARQVAAEKKSQIFYQLTQTRLVLDALETLVRNTLADVMRYAPEECDILNQRPDHDDFFKELSRFEARISKEIESNLSLYERVLIGPGQLSPADLETRAGYARESHLKLEDFRKQTENRCREILLAIKRTNPERRARGEP